MTFQCIRYTNHSCLSNGWMGCDSLFDGACAESVSGYIDDVVCSGHDRNIAVSVNHTRITLHAVSRLSEYHASNAYQYQSTSHQTSSCTPCRSALRPPIMS